MYLKMLQFGMKNLESANPLKRVLSKICLASVKNKTQSIERKANKCKLPEEYGKAELQHAKKALAKIMDDNGME